MTPSKPVCRGCSNKADLDGNVSRIITAGERVLN